MAGPIDLYRTTPGGAIHPTLEWRALTRGLGPHAFGYYDRDPFSPGNQYHLFFQFDQQARLPRPGELARVGVVDVDSGESRVVMETRAWCHQQGAMAQWIPGTRDQFVVNDFRQGTSGREVPIARVYTTGGEHVRDYDYPVYRLAPDGRHAATLNFARITRRGYAYASAPLPEAPVPDLDADGLFLLDLHAGERALILSYRHVLDHHPDAADFDLNGERALDLWYHWMNHAGFNSDGSRVMVLHRKRMLWWKTYMWTCRLDGSDPLCSLPHEAWQKYGISHQLWGRTPREILIDGKPHSGPDAATPGRRGHAYLVFDERAGFDAPEPLAAGTGYQGHLNFSPDGEWLVADTYPREGVQYLCLTRVADGETRQIGAFHHAGDLKGDVRCDLHPRWSGDGRYLSVDTIHHGRRAIMVVDAGEAKALFA